MLKPEIPMLAERLNALAETFDKRPVSPKALEVWFDSLKEFPSESVLGVLLGWPKTNTRFPSPAEVWKVCNETAIKSREAVAEAHRAQNSGSVRDYVGPTPQGKQIIAEMRKMLTKPRKSMTEHWQAMLDNSNSTHLQRSFAREALRNLGQSETAQDEREAA